ncbi:PAS domain-containing protein [Azospirillum doebereinerae]
MPENPEAGGRVLVFTPWGRDADSAGRLLSGRGIEPVPVRSVAELAGAIDDRAGAVLVTEEAFARQDLAPLFAALDAQPGWSDLPFVFLTAHRTGPRRAIDVFTDALRERAVNVMTLERPLSRVSLFSALDWALAARRRQFQTRDQLRELERQADRLRRGEDRLRRAHDQLRLAQTGGGVGVFTLDIASGRMAVSPEFCRIFGVPPREHYPAATFEALTIPEDAALRSSPDDRRTGTSVLDVEYRIRRADTGALRWVARRAEFTQDADGKPLRMAGVVQDVTTRKEAEASLRESELRFRSFAQSMPNQFWTAAPDGRVEWANDRMLSYSGFSPETLTGEGWVDFVHPDDLPEVARQWARAVASGEPYETESRLRRHDGAYRWHIGRALPETGPDGNILRWIGTNTDIQDQKTAQAALADSNAALEHRVAERTREFDQVWRLSHDLLAVLGEDRTLRAVNPAWTRLLGFEAGELVGRSIDSLFQPEGHGAIPLPPGIEGRIRHKDGGDRWIAWMTARDEGGILYAYGRDITTEREAQAALRDAEERLRQSQKMEAVGQLTGGMAHDFNNLLQAMSGCLQLVGRRAGHVAGVEKVLDAGRQAVDRGASMIRQLMAFSRQQSLQPEVFDVRDRLLGMRTFLDRALRADLRLEFDLQGSLWPVLADPVQFELAVLNLATNARDALDKGGLIVVGAGNVEMSGNDGLNGSFVRVWVKDNGHGIAASMVGRVFEPFFTTKAIGKGTGLGLAQVYGFCRQSGGTATVESAEGRGTTVSLLLPRSVAVGGGKDHTPNEPLPNKGGGARVLMVEDDPVVAPVIMAALEELGYRVSRATTGEEALQRLRQGEEAELLFTDVVMPGTVDGITLAKESRRLRPALPVLLTTGYSEDLAAIEGLQVLPKPYRIEELALVIEKTLNRSKLEETS